MRSSLLFLCSLIGAVSWSTTSSLAECAEKREANFWELDDASHTSGFDPDIVQASPDPRQFPQTLKQGCGKNKALAKVFRSGVINVPLGDGRSFDFVPLFLQRKTEWSCVRIKPRIACVTESTADGQGGRKITLQSDMGPPERIMPPVTMTVDRSGRVLANNDNYFALVPLRMNPAGTSTYDVRDRIKAAMDGVKCTQNCSAMRGWAADRKMIDIVRYVRLTRLPKDEVKKDVGLFLDKVGTLNTDSQALQALIGANEISLNIAKRTAQVSPFEVDDAVDGDSGPSFGVHQIDVATNECTARSCFRQPFREALDRLSKRENAPQDFATSLAKARQESRHLFEKPIREYTPEELGLFHRVAPLITEELRGELGRAQYLELYARYLKTDTGCMSALRKLGEPFLSSLGTQLYAVDVKNQFGSTWLVRLAVKSWDQHYSHDRALKDMLDDVMNNTKQGREHPRDVDRRQTNLKLVLSQFTQPVSGGEATNCDVTFTTH